MNILPKILNAHTSLQQLILAIVGTVIGMVLLLFAIQFHFDIKKLTTNTSGTENDFIIINKKVNLLNTIGGQATFNQEEIEEIGKQPFVNEVATFTSNRFRLLASSSMMGFQTELFFEAIPDEFVDVNKRRFKWKEGQQEVPMVVSRDYLALYNFGFAPSQGLPQLTPTTIRQVTLDLTMIGNNGNIERMKGRIVGFSDKINSVLVPQNFLEYANAKLGATSSPPPSRLLLSTENPYSKELNNFLTDNFYEVSTGQLIGGELKSIITLLTVIIAGLGGLIFLLAMLVVLQNFRLLVAKSSGDIRRLIELGYRHQSISIILNKSVIRSAGFIIGIVFLVMLLFRWFWVQTLTNQGFEMPFGFSPWTYIAFIMVAGGYVYFNVFSIRKNIQALAV